MNVLVTGRMPDAILSRISARHQVVMHSEDRPMERGRLLSSVGDIDGLLSMITDRIDQQLLAAAPGLRIVANCGVGYNHIDVPSATERGILVTHTPDVLTDATADLAFGLMLATARRMVEGDRRTRAGEFRFWAPLHFLGHEISGKTLGIIGFGRIGRAVARRAAGFNMKVLYYTRRRISDADERLLEVEWRDLAELLRQSDVVSLHVPLQADTRHLIGPEALGQMKPSAFLINTSRGPVVDEAALVEALRSRRIAGAGLDVYENEPHLTPGLSDLENVVLLPHVGSATIETRTRMLSMAADNLLAALDGRRPPNCLNCSEVYRRPSAS